jgi:hypothetical protein
MERGEYAKFAKRMNISHALADQLWHILDVHAGKLSFWSLLHFESYPCSKS